MDVFDLHRFPSLSTKLTEMVRGCDFVGFSVVTSTFAVTRQLTAAIKTSLREGAPKVVLGGHAVTLQPDDFTSHSTFQWDYLIKGDGELPFAHLVSNYCEGVALHEGVVEHPQSRALRPPFHWTGDEWTDAPWINRRQFLDPAGVTYEPTRTRSEDFREAHVVMSRGCAWTCSFCTEAVLRGERGEARRTARDVTDEIEGLVESEGVNRIQFVDDNLLPQIAAPRNNGNRPYCIEWTASFSAGLTAIKRKARTFGWRGIFRFEDFIAYEHRDAGWYEHLAESGCSLLAFGVEHGSEETRRKLKGGTVSNDQIEAVIARLGKHGIASKGYFIIGGPDESARTSQSTIDFAISSGFTLAYFALYKHFRRLVKLAKVNPINSETRERRLLSFRVLQADFEGRINAAISEADCLKSFGEIISAPRLAEAKEVAAALRARGFAFSELFKYNDFHDFQEQDADLRFWESETSGCEDFLRCVRKAYLLFYARRAFIENYELLLRSGY